ncbi:MAG: T9SS type A sorting domain-containing protein [Candidatus Latescibacterota bacterium]|nr:MAG: T9SS type A sorting domain-containing protein [Candidatus Latescibacterota bacterium]
MKKARSTAARLCALGSALTVLLAFSHTVQGVASPDEQHAYPETKSKTKDGNRHGVGFHVCTDHDNRRFTGVENQTPGELDYREPTAPLAKTATTDTPRTWTFLFYDDADFEAAYDPFNNFVSDAHSDVNVNVIILRDRNDRPASVWHLDERHRARMLEYWGEVNMARSTTLKRFVAYGKTNYPADRYFLAMYDHGGGWRGACEDVTNGGFVTLRSIAQGIGDAGGVDILAFTAPCLMGAMESVYEVRECVEVYIGSEDLSGYVYWIGIMGDICDVLNDSESLSNEDIGKRIIEIVENNPAWSEDPRWKWSTISAMTTSGVTLAVQQLDVIAEYMSVHTALLLDNLETSRARTWLLGSGANYDTKSVDVYDFTVRLSEEASDPFLLKSLQDLWDLLDDAIIAECHRETSTTRFPHGLSLYFPSSIAGYAIGYGRVLDLTRDTSWDEFLLEYYRYQRAPRGRLAGSVVADCPTAGSPLEGVTVTACQASTGDLLGAAVSEHDGSYEIRGLVADDYTVEAVPPLGYDLATRGVNVTLRGGGISGVDLALSCTGESNNPSGVAYWKRAIRAATGGGGQALVDAAEFCAYLDAIDAHFTSKGINVYAPPAASKCDVKLAIAADLLNPLPPVKTAGVARCHLMAMLLNVAAGNIRTSDVISKDGATVSQAITHCHDLLSIRPVDALVIANLINNGCTVPRGWIPLSTPQIAFTPPLQSGETSREASLSVSVSPNPFNPTTTISFTVPQSSHVTLSIYDIAGRRIKTLVDRTMERGLKRAVWDGRDTYGNPVSSGVYFYRVKGGGAVAIGKILLLK